MDKHRSMPKSLYRLKEPPSMKINLILIMLPFSHFYQLKTERKEKKKKTNKSVQGYKQQQQQQQHSFQKFNITFPAYS